MRTAEQVAEAFVHGLMGDNERTTVQRWMLAQTIANAVKESQKPVAAVRAYAQDARKALAAFDGPHLDSEHETYVARVTAALRAILEMLSSEDTER